MKYYFLSIVFVLILLNIVSCRKNSQSSRVDKHDIIVQMPLTNEENEKRRKLWDIIRSPFIKWEEKEQVILSEITKRGSVPHAIFECSGGLVADTKVNYSCYLLIGNELVYLEHHSNGQWVSNSKILLPQYIKKFNKIKKNLMTYDGNTIFKIFDSPSLFVTLWYNDKHVNIFKTYLPRLDSKHLSFEKIASSWWWEADDKYDILTALYESLFKEAVIH